MRCEPSLGRRVAKRPGQTYAVTAVSDCMMAPKKKLALAAKNSTWQEVLVHGVRHDLEE